MPKIDPASLPPSKIGSDYPPPYDQAAVGRAVHDLSKAAGITDWVANHVTIAPGSWSSQRHWHEGEDELAVVLAGEGVLIDDMGRTPMRAGDIALFPKGDGNGHHLVNESDADLVIVALSNPERSLVTYPDIDLLWHPDKGDVHKDGSPY